MVFSWDLLIITNYRAKCPSPLIPSLLYSRVIMNIQTAHFFSAGKHQSIQDVLNRGKNVLFTHNADVTASCACHMLHACRMLIMHICSIYSACVCFVHQLWENNYVNCIIFWTWRSRILMWTNCTAAHDDTEKRRGKYVTRLSKGSMNSSEILCWRGTMKFWRTVYNISSSSSIFIFISASCLDVIGNFWLWNEKKKQKKKLQLCHTCTHTDLSVVSMATRLFY